MYSRILVIPGPPSASARAHAIGKPATHHITLSFDDDSPAVTWPILHALRREITAADGWSLRDLYRTLETPGTNRLRDAHAALDAAVRAAYGMNDREDPLAFLLGLNLQCGDKESQGHPITPPGLPACLSAATDLVSTDCVTAPKIV